MAGVRASDRSRVAAARVDVAVEPTEQRLAAFHEAGHVVAALAERPPLPRRRVECVGGVRPCIHAECRYHLYAEAVAQGRRVDLEKVLETCALDLADRGGLMLSEVAVVLRISRERVRQIESKALRKLQATARVQELGQLADLLTGRPAPPRVRKATSASTGRAEFP